MKASFHWKMPSYIYLQLYSQITLLREYFQRANEDRDNLQLQEESRQNFYECQSFFCILLMPARGKFFLHSAHACKRRIKTKSKFFEVPKFLLCLAKSSKTPPPDLDSFLDALKYVKMPPGRMKPIRKENSCTRNLEFA